MAILILDITAAEANIRENLRMSGLEDAHDIDGFVRVVRGLHERASARGDGVAIYENWELGHPDLGQRQYVSFGSEAAQLETFRYSADGIGLAQYGFDGGYLPKTLPNIGGHINWRYQLVAIILPTRTVTAEVDWSVERDQFGGRVGNSVDHS